jgi:hypothetical protein
MIFDKKNIARGGSVMAVSTQMHSMHPGSKGPQKGPPPHAAASSLHPARPTIPPHGHAPAPAHPHAPAAPTKKPAQPEKKGHGLLYTLLTLTVIGLGGVFWTMRAKGPAEPTPEALVTQMEDTALSAAPTKNIYGGMIFSDHGNPPSVTVAGVPNKACVSAAWRLARTGLVTINGVMPERVSAAILAEICNQGDANAISWTPNPKN